MIIPKSDNRFKITEAFVKSTTKLSMNAGFNLKDLKVPDGVRVNLTCNEMRVDVTKYIGTDFFVPVKQTSFGVINLEFLNSECGESDCGSCSTINEIDLVVEDKDLGSEAVLADGIIFRSGIIGIRCETCRRC